jgi:hypothetical protein
MVQHFVVLFVSLCLCASPPHAANAKLISGSFKYLTEDLNHQSQSLSTKSVGSALRLNAPTRYGALYGEPGAFFSPELSSRRQPPGGRSTFLKPSPPVPPVRVRTPSMPPWRISPTVTPTALPRSRIDIAYCVVMRARDCPTSDNQHVDFTPLLINSCSKGLILPNFTITRLALSGALLRPKCTGAFKKMSSPPPLLQFSWLFYRRRAGKEAGWWSAHHQLLRGTSSSS